MTNETQEERIIKKIEEHFKKEQELNYSDYCNFWNELQEIKSKGINNNKQIRESQELKLNGLRAEDLI